MPRVTQAPPPGVVRNATPEATPGRWYDVNLVRFRGGQLQPIGGNVAIVGSGVSDLPRDMLTWHDNARVRWAAFGTDTKLYAYRFDTQVLTDITPAGVGALDPPGALDGLRPGRLRRGRPTAPPRSLRHRPAGYRRDDGRQVVAWTRSARICWSCRPRTGICSAGARDADHAGRVGDRRARPEPRRDRHRPAPRRAARRRRRSAQDRVVGSGEPRRVGGRRDQPRRRQDVADADPMRWRRRRSATAS